MRIVYFDPSHICFCSMHSVNLGYGLWVAGSTLILLVEHYEIWGGGDVDMSDRYKSAWLHFNGWTKANKIQYLSFNTLGIVAVGHMHRHRY